MSPGRDTSPVTCLGRAGYRQCLEGLAELELRAREGVRQGEASKERRTLKGSYGHSVPMRGALEKILGAARKR